MGSNQIFSAFSQRHQTKLQDQCIVLCACTA